MSNEKAYKDYTLKLYICSHSIPIQPLFAGNRVITSYPLWDVPLPVVLKASTGGWAEFHGNNLLLSVSSTMWADRAGLLPLDASHRARGGSFFVQVKLSSKQSTHQTAGTAVNSESPRILRQWRNPLTWSNYLPGGLQVVTSSATQKRSREE